MKQNTTLKKELILARDDSEKKDKIIKTLRDANEKWKSQVQTVFKKY